MNGLALLTQKIEIIHFFHWHIPTIGPIKVTAWIGMLETRDGSTQLTGNDSIVKTRQMEILMTAIFKEQPSNSWKIIIIIEMVISQNFRIIHNALLSISLCGINHLWYMMLYLMKRPKSRCFASGQGGVWFGVWENWSWLEDQPRRRGLS